MSITVNTRNQFRGAVIRINDGPVVSEVEIETPAGIITSVVTSSSIRAVDLRVGDEAVAMFKSTEVLIGKL
ncbi:MAG: TOBE domain-containing protein [Pseudomonadota bacterium]|jgi:molybdopterin-binding protein|nr:TOBE domain-containing protein [Pseudomonadota bacterium]